MRMKCFVFLAALMFCTVSIAAQDTYSTGFEPPQFTPGDVNGQNGWGYIDNSPTGGVIEAVPAGSPAAFGTQSLALRTRNDFFGVANRLFSPAIAPPAGENGSTVDGVVVPDPESHFSASLWFHTPASPLISTRGDGRIAELDPASKGPDADDPANRYAVVRLYNTTNGVNGKVRVEMVWFTSTTTEVRTVAVLEWNEWYRFDYLIHLVDGTDGDEPNDRFTLTIFDVDGNQLGAACGSTWELGWKSGTFGGGATARAINGFDFWSTTGPVGAVAGHLDNITYSAFDGQLLTVTIGGSTNACAGATTLLTANATGGALPLAYVWRNASNEIVGTESTFDAQPGTYTVTVTDALCATASDTVTIAALSPLAVTITGPNVARATLTANVTGGSRTISSYVWRNASNAIAGSGPTFEASPGTYTVTVSDASCGTATSAPFVVAAAVLPDAPALSDVALALLFVTIAAAALLRLR